MSAPSNKDKNDYRLIIRAIATVVTDPPQSLSCNIEAIAVERLIEAASGFEMHWEPKELISPE